MRFFKWSTLKLRLIVFHIHTVHIVEGVSCYFNFLYDFGKFSL